MTQPAPPPVAGHHRISGTPGVTRIIRTDDLPAGVDVMAAGSGGLIFLRASLDRVTARRLLRHALTELHRYPGMAAFPLLAAEMRLRHLQRRAEEIMVNASAAIQQAGTVVSEHATGFIAGTAAVAGSAVIVTTYALSGPAAASHPSHAGPYRPKLPVIAALPQKPLSYLGAYEPQGPSSYSGMVTFGKTIGRPPNLAMYYAGWDEQFQVTFAQQAVAHGAWPVVQVDPSGISLAAIAEGQYDAYLTMFADEVADFGKPVVISFGHEMNGGWYSWGYKNTPPATFIAAWQHIVKVFRGENAFNVTWMWTINRTGKNTGPVCDWWPGSSYVTWVGIDGYYNNPGDNFGNIFAPAISQVRECSADPVLIGETAASVPAGQFRAVRDLFDSIRGSGYLGFVWFDEDQNAVQDWRLETDPVPVARLFRQETKAWRLEHGFRR